MVYPFFTVYIVVGFVISLVVISWAIRSGQFRDQQRARFLPLENEPERIALPPSRTSVYEIYALGLIAAAGLLTSGALLVYSLLYGGR